jgi:hypothetical protein
MRIKKYLGFKVACILIVRHLCDCFSPHPTQGRPAFVKVHISIYKVTNSLFKYPPFELLLS